MHKQYLTPIKQGTLADVKLGTHVVFEETDEKGILHQCTGLEYIVQIEPNIVIVDNHDRVLEFWPKGFPVIHVDQHTDMRPVGADGINVGNFLRYALDTQLITGITQINTEYSLLQLKNSPLIQGEGLGERSDIESEKFILDIDLDFRHPDMSIEQYNKTIQIISFLIKKAKMVTIATSPYFLDQNLAIKILREILV